MDGHTEASSQRAAREGEWGTMCRPFYEFPLLLMPRRAKGQPEFPNRVTVARSGVEVDLDSEREVIVVRGVWRRGSGSRQ